MFSNDSIFFSLLNDEEKMMISKLESRITDPYTSKEERVLLEKAFSIIYKNAFDRYSGEEISNIYKKKLGFL